MRIPSWNTLLEAGQLARHRTSREEIRLLLRAGNRNLRDSEQTAVSADTRFACAYEAAILYARAVVACSGYRPRGEGHHRTTLIALVLAMGEDFLPVARSLDRARKRRNVIAYERPDVASEADAQGIHTQVTDLRARVERWIWRNHPDLI